MILALDPGYEETAWIVYDEIEKKPLNFNKEKNEDLLKKFVNPVFNFGECYILAIEWISNFGKPAGQEIFRTCLWVGRFIERWPFKYQLVIRPDIKLCLCNNRTATDKFIREALIFRFGESEKQVVGNKKSPGILYGIAGDVWSALAVAIVAGDKMNGG